MDTEKLKPFNEFNSEKSAMVNEICYRLFNEQNNNFFKELKKIELPKHFAANTQIDRVVGAADEYGDLGFVPILFNTGYHALAFGKYTDGSVTKVVIKNTSNTEMSTSGVLYLMVMEVK